MTCPICQSELYRNDAHFLIDGVVMMCINSNCKNYLDVVKLVVDTQPEICYTDRNNGGTR
jgi:hypothetical protein